MRLLNKLAQIAEKRVSKYGAQYYTFAIFGCINYPLVYLYQIFIGTSEGEWIRIIATILCFILLLHEKWPEKLKKFLPLYWYFTLMVSIPMLGVFLLLIDKVSLDWLMNFNVGVMVMVLLLDSITFLILEVIGIVCGILLFYAFNYYLSNWPDEKNLILFLYIFTWISLLGTIFSRNKEVFNNYARKILEDLNANLEQEVEDLTKVLNSKGIALKKKNYETENENYSIKRIRKIIEKN